MENRLSMIIASHLSDIQTGLLDAKDVNNKLNFVKYLVSRHSDLKSEIDEDKEWEEFTKTRFYKK